MIHIEIPGSKDLRLSHLVLDYNGTVACDGRLIPGVRKRLQVLPGHLAIHVLTADTFGSVERELAGLSCNVSVIPKGDQAQAKADYVMNLGIGNCACIGNGRNDRRMLKEAALGIAVIQTEGASVDAVLSADVVIPSILDALDLFLHPLRLVATLRS